MRHNPFGHDVKVETHTQADDCGVDGFRFGRAVGLDRALADVEQIDHGQVADVPPRKARDLERASDQLPIRIDGPDPRGPGDQA